MRLQLTHGPEGPGVLADGRTLPVPPHTSATEVGLAAARRHAARSGRDLRVEVVDGAAVTLVAVSPHGTVTLLEAPATQPLPRVVPEEPVTTVDRTTVHVVPPPRPVPTVATAPAGSAWVSPPSSTRPRRPVSSLVIAGLVAVAVVVGAVGTGVATLSTSQALPDSCRPVTIYAVDGQGGSSDVLRGVTDPLAKQFGEKVSVVTVPAPPTGGSFASAESDAVSSLATAVGDHVDGCPTGSLMLFGYSQGAQVAGDLASRVGTGLEPRIPATLVQAVGLFGDPARSPRTRAVPDGTAGQGALPPRAVGFGSLDARTIEICAPGDPVCDSPANAASPPLEQAVASPVHASYQQLPVASGTTAPQWAATSLGKVVAAIPTTAGPAATGAGTAPQSGPEATTTSGAEPTGTASAEPDSTGTGSAGTGSTSTGSAGTGSAGTGSAGTGSAGTGSAGDYSTESAPTGSTGTASTGTGSPGTGSPGTGSAGAGTAPRTGGAATGGSYDQGGAAGTGGTGVTTTTAPPATSESSTGGDAGAGAGVSTRRSGSASSTTTADEGSDSSTTGSSGQGSTGTSSTGSTAGTSSADDGYGTDAGSGAGSSATGTTGAESSAPASTRAPSGSATKSTTPGNGTSQKKTGEKKDKDKDKTGGTTTTTPSSEDDASTRTKTDAAWSLGKGLTGFKSTPWNNQNATDPSSAASPNVPGRQAVKFEMPGGGKRTEAEPDVPEFQEGQKAFVGYSGFFAKGFPTTTDTWQVIMQFKQPGTGSPPLAVEVGKGQLRLANNGRNEKDFCPVTDGQAFSFRLGITFGGAVDAWCNGQQTLSGFRTPESNVQGSAYLKTGIYRDEAITQDSTLFVNDLKVGKTLESVSDLAGANDGSGAGTTTGAGASADRDTGVAASPTTSSVPSESAAGSSGTGTGTAGSAGAGRDEYEAAGAPAAAASG
ncbi:cutinase family protein [Actinomycetospora sp. TBRC 11914]|uniref:cutinase family protein n=1 Tax=Actinomycetospora sp. TBRC 11914 TaxID=2729387 RepID=UPI00145D773D|nr:heparin lyase I family protein [Actinomycetospora sp. TBRC 11914]NMO88648.1 cutinase family protein [Actinomycetospora sp. TBRC 11914]